MNIYVRVQFNFEQISDVDFFLSFCPSACVSACLPAFLPACLPVFLSFLPGVCLSIIVVVAAVGVVSFYRLVHCCCDWSSGEGRQVDESHLSI